MWKQKTMKNHQVNFLSKFGDYESLKKHITGKGLNQMMGTRVGIEPELQDTILNSRHHGTIVRLARNPSISSDSIDRLIADPELTNRISAANVKKLSKEQQEKLLSQDNHMVNYQLASNRHLHPDVYEKLSQNKTFEVKGALAENPSISSDLIRKMYDAKHEKADALLKARLGEHPNAPDDVKQKFYQYVNENGL